MSRFKEYNPHLSMEVICSLFGKSRQAWYKHELKQADTSMKSALILCMVKEVRKDLPRVGTRKLYHILKDKLVAHNISIGRDSLFNLLSEHNLQVRTKRRKTKTTYSYSKYRKYPNLIKGLVACRPNQIWVSDITYISTKQGFCYLSLITDLYSHKIVGHELRKDLTAEGCLTALSRALETRTTHKQLIHHSDRGMQYFSDRYVKLLQDHEISISMTENGSPYENAVAERVNGILKIEFGLDNTFKHYTAAKKATNNSVSIYNDVRPHASCDFMTPNEAHNKEGVLNRRWKNYYQSSNANENKELQLIDN